ncbi:uncharacterized protein BP5553_03301 [Venustampulla echinocandica]|uniref:RING-type domain-containing protein n=1 Tax=Venustampulla echinocandica TaxID=2656787 RepID=A0A370TTV4_9HELO|nr:uncharacterized protein BP5553_03301 [Venustampulla echinocandica]RDL38961.1 hypothetical protein BP5553_03301 [Venustampulla echinocandica]
MPTTLFCQECWYTRRIRDDPRQWQVLAAFAQDEELRNSARAMFARFQENWAPIVGSTVFEGPVTTMNVDAAIRSYSQLVKYHILRYHGYIGTMDPNEGSITFEYVVIGLIRSAITAHWIAGVEATVIPAEMVKQRQDMLLSKVTTSSLAIQDQQCNICYEVYCLLPEHDDFDFPGQDVVPDCKAGNKPDDKADDIPRDHPCKTRCGHVFGQKCIRKWMSETNFSSCPYCRAPFETLDMLNAGETVGQAAPWWLEILNDGDTQ